MICVPTSWVFGKTFCLTLGGLVALTSNVSFVRLRRFSSENVALYVCYVLVFLEIRFGQLLCFLMISEMNDYILYMLKCRLCRIWVLMS